MPCFAQMTQLREQIMSALDYEFRLSVDIARRAGVDATQAAPALGHLRQRGVVEWAPEGNHSLWRLRPQPARRDLSS